MEMDLDAEFAVLDVEAPEGWRESMVDLARRAASAGRLDLARTCFVKLAIDAESQGRHAEALGKWKEILKTDAHDALGLVGIGLACAGMGKVEEALAALSQAEGGSNTPNELRRLARGMTEQLREHGTLANLEYAAGATHADFKPGDIGVLYEVIVEAVELAPEDQLAAETMLARLRNRARLAGDADAVRTCDFHLAVDVIREPRRRIARCRRLLRQDLRPRGRAHVLAALSAAEEAVGWTRASKEHREEALRLAADDPYCRELREKLQ